MLATDVAQNFDEKVNTPDFWQTSALLHQQFLQRSAAIMHPSPDYTVAELKQALAPLEDLGQNQFLVPLSLTNLEDCRSLQHGKPFAIKNLSGGVSAKPGQVGMIFGAITLENGFSFLINYTEPMISLDLVKSFGEAVLKRLDAVVAS